jgi:hypothetical protein
MGRHRPIKPVFHFKKDARGNFDVTWDRPVKRRDAANL